MDVNRAGVGSAAAASAVTAAEAAAAVGTAEAQVAYQLTTQAVKDEAAVVIPLLLLSFASIAEGLVAYTASLAAGKAADAAVRALWQSAVRSV